MLRAAVSSNLQNPIFSMKSILVIFLLVLIAPYKLLAQDEILRTPDERFVNLMDYNFQPNYIEVEVGLRMHYVDEGEKDNPVVLLLHGEPSWSYLYRKMIPLLRNNGFRVIAPDLIGFGRSDKFSNKNQYTYERSVKWMVTFLQKLDIDEIVLFCQDWGGLIGLRAVTQEPNRFSMIVASNTLLPTGSPRMPEAFYNWLDYSQNKPEFNSGRIVNSASLRELTKEEIAAYDAPFPSENYKAAARIYPALVPLTVDDPQSIGNAETWKELNKWTKPFLTIFGDSDPITGWSQNYFKSQIPGAKGQNHQILNADHFIQEDKGAELVELITEFYIKNTANK